MNGEDRSPRRFSDGDTEDSRRGLRRFDIWYADLPRSEGDADRTRNRERYPRLQL